MCVHVSIKKKKKKPKIQYCSKKDAEKKKPKRISKIKKRKKWKFHSLIEQKKNAWCSNCWIVKQKIPPDIYYRVCVERQFFRSWFNSYFFDEAENAHKSSYLSLISHYFHHILEPFPPIHDQHSFTRVSAAFSHLSIVSLTSLWIYPSFIIVVLWRSRSLLCFDVDLQCDNTRAASCYNALKVVRVTCKYIVNTFSWFNSPFPSPYHDDAHFISPWDRSISQAFSSPWGTEREI